MTSPFPQLDYLVIACHPDDAEIGCGGAILSLKAQGAKVGVLDLTNGELARQRRLAEPFARRRSRIAASRCNHDPPTSTARSYHALLGRRPSRSRRRQRSGRCGPLLGKAVENGYGRPAPPTRKDSLFS